MFLLGVVGLLGTTIIRFFPALVLIGVAFALSGICKGEKYEDITLDESNFRSDYGFNDEPVVQRGNVVKNTIKITTR